MWIPIPEVGPHKGTTGNKTKTAGSVKVAPSADRSEDTCQRSISEEHVEPCQTKEPCMKITAETEYGGQCSSCCLCKRSIAGEHVEPCQSKKLCVKNTGETEYPAVVQHPSAKLAELTAKEDSAIQSAHQPFDSDLARRATGRRENESKSLSWHWPTCDSCDHHHYIMTIIIFFFFLSFFLSFFRDALCAKRWR